MKKFSRVISLGAGLVTGLLYAHPVLAASNLCANAVGGGSLCGRTGGIGDLIALGINIVLFVGFVAALIWLIIGGIKWITSGGDKTATESAKGAVTSALIGLVVVVAAYILINVVLGFFGLGSLSSLNTPTLNTFIP